ncbi:MAG: DUF5301 domain-containing protein [Tissierella sp.]|nr:DUF5301 domain-containing protein [Tissierella sp.]
MKRVTKGIITLGIIAIVLILMISKNDRPLKGPNPEDLSSIILIDIIDEEGVQKITINQQIDINNFLDIFSHAKRTGEQSVSEFPDKTKFTAVLYKLKSSENYSWRSMYEENGDLYIDQPFVGIFKINSNDLDMLDQIIRAGDKEEISVPISDIRKI